MIKTSAHSFTGVDTNAIVDETTPLDKYFHSITFIYLTQQQPRRREAFATVHWKGGKQTFPIIIFNRFRFSDFRFFDSVSY